MVDIGYSKAQSDNLPRVDAFMVAQFLKNNLCFMSSEMKGVKTQSASREQYGDSAVGYVQLKREQTKCIVKCKICPEHKVHSKQYNVTLCVDEVNEIVEIVQCHDCAASAGGCKHAIAFLMWIHRRSEEPATTSVESYWKKSLLSKMGTSIKYLRANKFGPPRSPKLTSNVSPLFGQVLKELKKKKINAQIIKHTAEYEVPNVLLLSLHQGMIAFVTNGGSSVDGFLQYLKENINDRICAEIEKQTKMQHKCELWHEIRYGRLSASKAFDVMRCKTGDGSLVESILGASKVPDTKAMQRGRELESKVLSEVKRKLDINIASSGVLVCQDYPFISASPDGIGDNFVVEVKCPTSGKTYKNYISDTDKVSDKCNVQVQLQMYASKRSYCLFCVADPKFEENKKVNILCINYNENYVNEILIILEEFWRKYIFPKIYDSVKQIL